MDQGRHLRLDTDEIRVQASVGKARRDNPFDDHEDQWLEYKLCKKAVTYATRADKRDRDEQLAEDLMRAHSAGDSREVHRLAKVLMPHDKGTQHDRPAKRRAHPFKAGGENPLV